MRCKACDKMLTDYETTRKDRMTGMYLDLCGSCHGASQKAFSDFEATVDSYVDFGHEDVYDLQDNYRLSYKEE